MQLAHDEEMGPMHGMYGTLDADLEEQRAHHQEGRVDSLPFVSPEGLSVPPRLMWTAKGIIDGLWREEVSCISPKAKDADMWVLIWEEVRRLHQEGTFQKSSMSRHIAPRRSKIWSCSNGLSLKAMRKWMRWLKMVPCWTEARWRREGPAQLNKKKRGGSRALAGL